MEKEVQTIKRVDALREMEIREDQYGKRVLFSVEFYTKEGELGVQQCDSAGNKIGSPTAVSIDNLRMFNDKKVVL